MIRWVALRTLSDPLMFAVGPYGIPQMLGICQVGPATFW